MKRTSGSLCWSLSLVLTTAALAIPANAQTTCLPVSGSGAGTSFGTVVAGQTYSYTATGLIGFNFDGCKSDADGFATAPCSGRGIADNAFLCPGLWGVSLVGRLNGECIQLGTSGSFVAPSSGELVLYYNDQIFGDNSGSFDVCLTVGELPPVIGCDTLDGSLSGKFFGGLVEGRTYAYRASRLIAFNLDGAFADPDGNKSGTQTGRSLAPATFVCPGLWAFSLVGKLNNACLQLGNAGGFVAPSSGALFLHFNDELDFDNSGAWDVCVDLAVPVDVKPRQCPNSIVNRRAVLPVAIAGTAAVPVDKIDAASVRLEGLAPRLSALTDVTPPYEPYVGKARRGQCHRLGADGITDLVLSFDQQALYQSLGTVTNGEVRVISLTGQLIDGTPIVGEDVVVIRIP